MRPQVPYSVGVASQGFPSQELSSKYQVPPISRHSSSQMILQLPSRQQTRASGHGFGSHDEPGPNQMPPIAMQSSSGMTTQS